MGSERHIRVRHLAGQVRALPSQAGVFAVTEVIPRPAVKSPFCDPRRVVGHQVIAQGVALVHGAPHLATARLQRHAGTVTQARGVRAAPCVSDGASDCASGCSSNAVDRNAVADVEYSHLRTILFVVPRCPQAFLRLPAARFVQRLLRHFLGVIGKRTHRDIELLAVRREDDVAGDVPTSHRRQLRDDHLRNLHGRRHAFRKGIAHHAVHLGHI